MYWTRRSRIPNLTRILELFRQLPEEGMQPRAKFLARHPVSLELEQKRASMWIKPRISMWDQDKICGHLRVQKEQIELSSFQTIASMLRIAGNRNLLPDLKTHLKVFGKLIEIFAGLGRCR